jgi:hypothetical protein
MNAFLIYLLPPAENRPLNIQAASLEDANLKEFDFIEAITGVPNLTHAWNEFGLRAEVVELMTVKRDVTI